MFAAIEWMPRDWMFVGQDPDRSQNLIMGYIEHLCFLPRNKKELIVLNLATNGLEKLLTKFKNLDPLAMLTYQSGHESVVTR